MSRKTRDGAARVTPGPDRLHKLTEPRVPSVRGPRGKRILDLLLGLALGITTLPFQGLGLLVSALAFRAYPIFRQKRLGLDGEPFTFIKIRSLPTTAPSEAAKHDLADVQNTFAGKFLRQTHLDEVLQLWSVVKGDMSMVGPRPEMIGLSDTYDPDFVQRRTMVRPGITGLWQISEACDGLIGEAPGYDLYYLENQSHRLDVWIMSRTMQKMFLGRTINFDDLDPAKVRNVSQRTALLPVDRS